MDLLYRFSRSLLLAAALVSASAAQPQTVNEVKEFAEPGSRPLSQESPSWVAFINAFTSENKQTWPAYLADAEFSATLRNGISRTTLHHAAMHGNAKVAEELIKAGVDPNAIDSLYGNTALHEAAAKGYVDVMLALIKGGARVSARSRDGSTPLHLAAGSEQPDAVALLLKMGTNVNARDKENITPLHCAVAASSVTIAKQLLDAGALLDSKSLGTWDMAADTTPLQMAAAQGNLEMVVLLVERGAALSITNADGQSALNLAHAGRYTHVEQYLQSKGAKY